VWMVKRWIEGFVVADICAQAWVGRKVVYRLELLPNALGSGCNKNLKGRFFGSEVKISYS